jgi:serine/threonine protein kinase/WD40 repeat protein
VNTREPNVTNTAAHCPQCGAPLPEGLFQGLCPRCVARQAEGILAARASASDPSTRNSQPSTKLRYFGDYELLEEIARGGMGVVFKARQLTLNRIVAVKLLLGGRFSHPEFVQRFRIEAQAAANLQHPHIVAIHEVGEHEGQQYFSMDYVEGPNLVQLVRDQPLPPKRAAALLMTIAEAVHYAHQHGIIHRDLKPSNILIDANDQPRVTDFGLAKRLNPDPVGTRCGASHFPVEEIGDAAQRVPTDLTLTGQVLGTPNYMSPEQAGGKRGVVGPLSDVYSLGAVLYLLLTGRAPFAADTLEETLRQVHEIEPASPRLLNPSVPRDVETICVKSLSKEPRRRYPSAQALADDLTRFLNDEPIQARRVSNPEKLWRWCRRKPALAVAIASTVILLLTVVVVSTVSAARLKRVDRARTEELYHSYLEQIRAKRQSVAAGHRQEGLDLIAKATAIRPSLELRNETIATLATLDVRPGRSWHFTKRLDMIPWYFDGKLERYAAVEGTNGIRIRRVSDDSEVTVLRHPIRMLRPLFQLEPLFQANPFSPDGRYLAGTFRGERHWVVWEVASGRLVLDDPRCRHGMAFSRDGNRLAASHSDGRIALYDLPSGSEIAAVDVGRPFALISLAPAADRVAGFGENETEVGIWDFATGNETTLTAPERLTQGDWGPGELIAACSATGRIHIWNARTGQWQRIIEAHDEHAVQVVFNHRGDLLASTSWDGTTRFCNPWTSQLLLIVPGGTQVLQFSLDDRQFALHKRRLGPQSMFEFLEIQESPVVQRIHDRFSGGAWTLDCSPDGRLLASVQSGEGVRLFDAESGRFLAEFPEDSTRSALFEPGSRSLLTCARDGVSRWPIIPSTEGGTNSIRFGPRQLLVSLNKMVYGALTPDGRWLAGTSEPDRVWAVDLTDPAHPIALGRQAAVERIAISPDGEWVASGSWNSYSGLHVWRIGSRTLEKKIPMSGVHLAASRDGHWLAVTGTLTNEVRALQIWDTRSWTLRHFAPQPASAAATAFSPDGRLVAFITERCRIQLHETESFRHLATLEAPIRANLTWLRFSPDGTRLAALEVMHGIQVWNLVKLREELKARGLDWEDGSEEQ